MLRLVLFAALSASTGASGAQVASGVPRPSELAQLQARDLRLSFTAEAARRARAALENAPAEERDDAEECADVEERAVAVLALGCGGGSADVARIESGLESGALPERRAAAFALGELASTGWPALERALTRDTAGLEEALCVTLALAARRGASVAEKRLWSLAQESSDLSRRAAVALSWLAGGAPEGLGDTLHVYYELRWRAAKTYGLVDGRRGQEARKAELFTNEEFLDRVVLAAAAELPQVALKTHMAEILREDERLGALRVAVLLMPEELERALQTGEWQPSPAAWHALLSEIDAQRAERSTRRLLAAAFQSSSALEPFAGRLLFRGGGDLPWTWVREQLERGDPALRAGLVEACGDRGEKELVPELAELLEARADLELFGEGLIALVRLAHAPAKKRLEELLQGSSLAEHEAVVRALARVQHDTSLRRYAEQALRREDLSKELRGELEVGLVQNGAPLERGGLRTALSKAKSHAKRLACVRALAYEPGAADLETMAALFPVDDDLDLNVALALALLGQGHVATSGLCSAALWSQAWNRSVLAGGLIVANAGPRGLLEELDSAPRTASERDLRRVGFALGEWGGIGAVETLARTRSEGDPVLQGALLGALSSRAEEGAEPATPRPTVKLDFPGDEAAGAAPSGTKKPGAKKKRPKAGG